MNTLLLKVFIHDHGDTRESLAKAMNLNSHTLYMKMKEVKNPKRVQQFTQSEIAFIARRYEMRPEDIVRVFFDDLKIGGDTSDIIRGSSGEKLG